MPVASRDLRSVHGTLLPNASCYSGLLEALINYILNFAVNFMMSCMSWQKKIPVLTWIFPMNVEPCGGSWSQNKEDVCVLFYPGRAF